MYFSTKECEIILESLYHYIHISRRYDEIDELLIKIEEELHGQPEPESL